MDYQKAREIRKTGLLSLINEELFENNKSVRGAVGSAISSRFKAKATGIKESLDPLNWIRKAAGKGAFGDLAVTGLGRTFGRKDKDIKAFGGYGRKGSKVKKDPKFTSVGNGPIRPLVVGDSVSDVLGKMYNFMTKTHQVYKIDNEIEQSFRQEQLDEDERRHKALVDAIRKFTGRRGVGGKKTEGDGGIGLLGGLGIGAVVDKLLDFGKKAASRLGGPLSRILRGVAKPIQSLGKAFFPKAFTKAPVPSMPAGRAERPTGPVNRTTRASTGSTRMRETMKARGAGRTAMPLGSGSNYEPTNKSLTRAEKVAEAVKPTAIKAVKVAAKALNGAKRLLRFLSSVPGLSTLLAGGVAYIEINDAIKAAEKGEITEDEMHKRIVRSIGGAIGAVAGGTIGAGVGAAVGGPVGAILGGIAGGIYAGAKGEDAAEGLYKFFTTNQEKTLEEQQAAIEKLSELRQKNAGAMHGLNNPKNEPTTKTTEPEISKDIKNWASKYKAQLKNSAGKGRGYSPTPKSSSVPEVQSSPTSSTGTNTPVVAVNNTTNNIGGKAPKVLQTASAKTRDSNVQYQIKNISVPV